jgi:hypothetical protein
VIAERCQPMPPGYKLNSECWTCGHTMAAHTTGMRCDICDVVLSLTALLNRRGQS